MRTKHAEHERSEAWCIACRRENLAELDEKERSHPMTTETTRHTTAPWTCDRNGIIKGPQGQIIAEVGRASTDADENVSNGFLIAAAPEMADALRAYLKTATDRDPNKDLADCDARARAILRRTGE